jgi:hypothetical protein
MKQYAGQQLTTGPQAQVYADHFIANHLNEVAGGQNYAEVSSKAFANPNDPTLAEQTQTLFQRETLQGVLLTPYAFWHLGTMAGWAAVVAFIGAGLFLIVSIFGFFDARRVAPTEELLGPTETAV